MRDNPCRFCDKAIKIGNRHYKNNLDCCANCGLMEKHREYLYSKRKYKRGERIKTLDEVANSEFVYIDNKIYHRGWVHSMQFRFLHQMVKSGVMYQAIRKQDS